LFFNDLGFCDSEPLLRFDNFATQAARLCGTALEKLYTYGSSAPFRTGRTRRTSTHQKNGATDNSNSHNWQGLDLAAHLHETRKSRS